MATNVGSDLTVDEYDVNEQKQRFKREDAELERKRSTAVERHETLRVSAIVSGVVVVVLGLCGGWLWNHNQPSDPVTPDSDGVREVRCVDNGGVWLPSDFTVLDHGYCAYPGKPLPAAS